MATDSVAATGASPLPRAPATIEVPDKGLKRNAIGFLSNVVIGVASTAPPYSLGRTPRFIVAGAVLWILLMTWICHRGIELSARMQQILLSFEVVMLVLFASVALIDVYTGSPAHSIQPHASWFNPFGIPFHDLIVAMLLGIFIYWGWDSGVAVNEESEDPNEGPGRAAVVSTLLLLAIYLFVASGAQSYHGTGFLANEENAS